MITYLTPNNTVMKIRFVLCFAICCIACKVSAQSPTISLLDTSRKVSIRGLSVVNDNVVWCSGSNGSVAKSIDGGKTFTWQTITGYEKRDFRDIEAFDANTALIIAVAEPAVILKTKDGGQTWKKVFEDTTKGMFLDAMDFSKNGMGWVVGDPINDQLFKALSIDFGDSWVTITGLDETNKLSKGEAFFASSGTNIKTSTDKVYPNIFATGGMASRLFYKNKTYVLPIVQGKESTGANSIDVFKSKAVVVGGDFANDKDTTNNCVLINLKGKSSPTFTKPQTPPNGYRSCVVYINDKTLVACGTSGIDISYDGGNNWQLISTQSFHVVQKAKNGNAIYLAGSRGKIARLSL
jgi:photosystem II stability/assembly factor-like uncharacterized protein